MVTKQNKKDAKTVTPVADETVVEAVEAAAAQQGIQVDVGPATSEKPSSSVRFDASSPDVEVKSKRYNGKRLSRNIVMIGVVSAGVAAIAAFALIVGNEDVGEKNRIQKIEKDKEKVVEASNRFTEDSSKAMLDAVEEKAKKEKERKEKERADLLAKINAANAPQYPEDSSLTDVDRYEREKLKAQVMGGESAKKTKILAAYEDGSGDGFLKSQMNNISDYAESVAQQAEKDQAERDARNAAAAKSNPEMPAEGVDSNDKWRAGQYQINKAVAESDALKPQIPPSKYILSEGNIIPVVLVTSIDSQLPGKITARTIENIYDSINGNYILIPRGTSIVGSYNTDVRDGQNRVFMAFNRMIFPNGASMQIGSMTAGDPQGVVGVEGEVFSNFWKMLGTSFLIAGVSSLAQPDNNVTNNYGSNGGTSSAPGQILADTAKANIERYMKYIPKITIKAGEKITIVVAKDMELNPAITRANVVKGK